MPGKPRLPELCGRRFGAGVEAGDKRVKTVKNGYNTCMASDTVKAAERLFEVGRRMWYNGR